MTAPEGVITGEARAITIEELSDPAGVPRARAMLQRAEWAARAFARYDKQAVDRIVHAAAQAGAAKAGEYAEWAVRETGFGVAGKLAWVHSAFSGKFVLVTVHGKRGRQGMDAAGCCRRSPGSPAMMPGRPTTAMTASPGTVCAVRIIPTPPCMRWPMTATARRRPGRRRADGVAAARPPPAA